VRENKYRNINVYAESIMEDRGLEYGDWENIYL
jgi:hypothetical protein